MKIKVFGFVPEETIESMPKGSQRFCFFQNIFVTRNNIFIPFGLDVYKTPEEVVQIYGGFPYITVNRTLDGGYSFNFGDIFDNFYFSLAPSSLDQRLLGDDNFMRIKQEFFEITILDKVPIVADIEFDLEIQLQLALENENFEEAAKIRDKIKELQNKKDG